MPGTSRIGALSCVGALLLLVAAGPAPARAYCRATTCDRQLEDCGDDARGCATLGVPTSWSSDQLDLVVDAHGSPRQGISGADLEAAVLEALAAWSDAECPSGGHPSISIGEVRVEDGPAPGYLSTAMNTNVIQMVDVNWPFGDAVVGRVNITFHPGRGELLDADIALNTESFAMSLTPDGSEVDLVAVLTHEFGHALGLDHSHVLGATMQPEAPGFATAQLRTLSQDDIAGVCAIYPPDRVVAEPAPPRAAPSATSEGCSVHAGAPATTSHAWLALASLCASLSWRRRRRGPHRA